MGQNNPVSWNYAVEKVDDQAYHLVFTAKLNPGWYIYSQYLESDDGPIPTSINFNDGIGYELVDKTKELGDKKEGYDDLFGMNIVKYAKEVKFVQKITVQDSPQTVKGYIEFMTCDDHQCLPPRQQEFSLAVN